MLPLTPQNLRIMAYGSSFAPFYCIFPEFHNQLLPFFPDSGVSPITSRPAFRSGSDPEYVFGGPLWQNNFPAAVRKERLTALRGGLYASPGDRVPAIGFSKEHGWSP